MSGTAPTTPPKPSGPRSRAWKWGRRALFAVVAFVALLAVSVIAVAHNLDRPWIKTRLRAEIMSAAGVDVDWRSVDLELLSGIALDDVVVHTRGGFELATAKKLTAAWTTALYTKQKVEHVVVADVAVHLAMDENGATSIDDLLKSDKPTNPAKPLSQKIESVLSTLKDLPTIDVTGLSLGLVRTDHGTPTDRMALAGLGLHVAANGASLGSSTAPLDLHFTRSFENADHDARAKIWLTSDVTGTDITTALDLTLDHQDFIETIGATRVVHSETHTHVDAAKKTTTVSIERTTVAEGIATTTATVEIPDEGPLVIRHAAGAVDFVRLVAFVPAGLLPIRPTLARGHVDYRIDDVAIGTLPKLSEGAKVAIEGELADVKVAGAEAANAKFSAHVEGLKAHASITLDRAKGPGASAEDVSLVLDATQAPDKQAFTGKLDVAFASAEGGGVRAKKGKVGVAFDHLDPDTRAGELTIDTELDALDAPAARVAKLILHAHGGLAGPLDADLQAARVDTQGLGFAPVHLVTKVTDLAIATPTEQSTGKGHVVLDAGNIHLQLDATKSSDAVDYEVAASAPSLALARRFLPAEIPVEKMGLTVTSKGRIDRLLHAPSLKETTELHVEQPGYSVIAARALDLKLESNGDANRHEVKADVAFQGLAVAGTNAADDHVAVHATIDRPASLLDLDVGIHGRATVSVKAKASFDRARHAVTYSLAAKALELAPAKKLLSVLPGLDGLDLSKLELDLQSKGTVLGAVASVEPFRLEKDAARTVGVEGDIGVKAKNVEWASGVVAMGSPLFGFEAKLHTKGEKRTVESHLDVASFHLANGPGAFEVAGVSDKTVFTVTGDLAEPDIEIDQALSIRSMKQNQIPGYVVGDAKIGLRAKRTKDGVIHVVKLEAVNPVGGTAVLVKGAIDPTEFQRRLSLSGLLRQDLAKVSDRPDRFAATGKSDVRFRIESSDLSVLRVIGDVKFDSVDVKLPNSKISLEAADGQVPIAIALRVTPRGIRMANEGQDNPYKSLRYADQHPLLSRSSFLTFRRLDTPQITISSFAGNLQIEQNIFSLRQFEMGVRDGRITGQLAFDWHGEQSTLEMHVRADGVKSSHGEPFTGNAALLVSAADHTVEGRADILKIGKRHLHDILDLQDPYHADAGFNRIRTALAFGYPDKLRLTFNHGFAGLHIELGGLARLISIDDIRGVPIGPIVDKFIPPFIPEKEAP